MPKTKERPKFIHQATTLEYLFCLQNMSDWSQILSNQDNRKSYNDFLKWILQQQYFKNHEKISIKKISEISEYPSTKISKWLREIYEDILELNEINPSLFCSTKGVEVELHFKYFDNYCSFKTSLLVLPRKYETFEFFFIKAKLGFTSFWVKEVHHTIDDNKGYISVFLEGGILNIYREFALAKAIFEGNLSYFDIYKKFDFEIDEALLRIRRSKLF